MFADKLRELRKAKGLTQKALAAKINVSSSALSQYERGQSYPRRENLGLLADYFGVTVAYLEGTSSIEDIEAMLNMDYAEGCSVREFLDMCLNIVPRDRTHLVFMASLMAKGHDESGE